MYLVGEVRKITRQRKVNAEWQLQMIGVILTNCHVNTLQAQNNEPKFGSSIVTSSRLEASLVKSLEFLSTRLPFGEHLGIHLFLLILFFGFLLDSFRTYIIIFDILLERKTQDKCRLFACLRLIYLLPHRLVSLIRHRNWGWQWEWHWRSVPTRPMYPWGYSLIWLVGFRVLLKCNVTSFS